MFSIFSAGLMFRNAERPQTRTELSTVKPTMLAFLKRIFRSSGASSSSMKTHEVELGIENDIPDSLTSAVNKKSKASLTTEIAEKKEQEEAKEHVKNMQSFAGDMISIQRDGAKFLGMIKNTDTLAKQSSVEGMTSAINLLTGCLTSLKGHAQAKESYLLGDKSGALLGATKAIRGPFEALSGGTSAINNGIQAFATPAKVASLSKAVQGLTIASAVGSGAFFILLGTPAVYTLYESGSTYHNLKKKVKEGGEKAGFEFLRSKLKITDSDRNKILDELFTDKKENAVIRSVKRFFNWVYGYDSKKLDEVKTSLKQILSENKALVGKDLVKALDTLDPNGELEQMLSEEDRAFAEDYISKSDNLKNLTGEERRNLIRISSVFYKVGLNVVAKKKEKQLERMIGKKATETIKANFDAKIDQIDKKTISEAVEAAKKGLVKSLAMNTAIAVACVLGFVGTVIGTVLTGGVYPLVSLIISVVTLAVWTGIDGYNLYESHKSGTATKKDKALMILSTIFMTGIIVAGSVLSAGTLSLIVSTALTIGWMMLLLYTIYTIRKKEKKSKPAAEASEAFAKPLNRELRGLGLTEEQVAKINAEDKAGYFLRRTQT